MTTIPCALCGKTWPEDPKHPGYPDVHHCGAKRLAPGTYKASVVTLIVGAHDIITVLELEGGSHDGELLTFQQKREA